MVQADDFYWGKETTGDLGKHEGRCEVLALRGTPNAWLNFTMGRWLNLLVGEEAEDGLERQNVRRQSPARRDTLFFTPQISSSRHLPEFELCGAGD